MHGENMYDFESCSIVMCEQAASGGCEISLEGCRTFLMRLYFFNLWLRTLYFTHKVNKGLNLEPFLMQKNSNSIVFVLKLMPSPSAESKFVLGVLKFVGIFKYLRCTQNSLGILKWANLCREI